MKNLWAILLVVGSSSAFAETSNFCSSVTVLEGRTLEICYVKSTNDNGVVHVTDLRAFEYSNYTTDKYNTPYGIKYSRGNAKRICQLITGSKTVVKVQKDKVCFDLYDHIEEGYFSQVTDNCLSYNGAFYTRKTNAITSIICEE